MGEPDARGDPPRYLHRDRQLANAQRGCAEPMRAMARADVGGHARRDARSRGRAPTARLHSRPQPGARSIAPPSFHRHTPAVSASLARDVIAWWSVNLMTLLDNQMTVNRYRQELFALDAQAGTAIAELEMLVGRELIDANSRGRARRKCPMTEHRDFPRSPARHPDRPTRSVAPSAHDAHACRAAGPPSSSCSWRRRRWRIAFARTDGDAPTAEGHVHGAATRRRWRTAGCRSTSAPAQRIGVTYAPVTSGTLATEQVRSRRPGDLRRNPREGDLAQDRRGGSRNSS